MKLKNFAFLLPILFLCQLSPVFSQTKLIKNTYTLELPPQEQSELKVYKVREGDLKKIRIPKNYIIVRKPSDETVFLWEIPARPTQPETLEKKEEKKEDIKTKTLPSNIDTVNLFEISKKLGVGEIKSGTTQEVIQQLLDKNK